MIHEKDVQNIKQIALPVSVISKYVDLRRQGANYVGLCPFHEERTPSFFVSVSRGRFKCFGCGKSGDVIDFIMLCEQLAWKEALLFLAAMFHIPVVETFANEAQRREQLARTALKQQVIDLCATFEHRLLAMNDAAAQATWGYLQRRGVTAASREIFHLGFGGVSTQDRYHHRLLFPQQSLSGQLIGFSGRTLCKGEKAKYINSADSPLYHKSATLYGLFQAKQAMVKQQVVYLVEGNMDVIMMHQAGIEHTVATCGTALTHQQAMLMKRFCTSVIILYDADAPGVQATVRAMPILLACGLMVHVASTAPAADPADFILGLPEGADAAALLADNTCDFITFLLLDYADLSLERRRAVRQLLYKILAAIPEDDFQEDCAKAVAQALDTSLATVCAGITAAGAGLSGALPATTKRLQVSKGSATPPTLLDAFRATLTRRTCLECELVTYVVLYGEVRLPTQEMSLLDTVMDELMAEDIEYTQPVLAAIYASACSYGEGPREVSLLNHLYAVSDEEAVALCGAMENEHAQWQLELNEESYLCDAQHLEEVVMGVVKRLIAENRWSLSEDV